MDEDLVGRGVVEDNGRGVDERVSVDQYLIFYLIKGYLDRGGIALISQLEPVVIDVVGDREGVGKGVGGGTARTSADAGDVADECVVGSIGGALDKGAVAL